MSIVGTIRRSDQHKQVSRQASLSQRIPVFVREVVSVVAYLSLSQSGAYFDLFLARKHFLSTKNATRSKAPTRSPHACLRV